MFAKWLSDDNLFFFALEDPRDGSVEISDERHRELIDASASGKVLRPDAEGYPVIQDPPPLSPEVPEQIAMQQRDRLLQEAALRIAPLQDAEDLGIATEEESALLLSWKRYRIELNRVPTLPGFPVDFDWPEKPQG